MKPSLSDEAVLAQIASARRAPLDEEPRAESAGYDAQQDLVMLRLNNGAYFAFPPQRVQALYGASASDLSAVEVSPSGLGLRWDSLDVDLSVPALLQGMFGTREWMRQLGAAGGAVRSEAKAKAARINGLKGGRPRKTAESTYALANIPPAELRAKTTGAKKS